MVINFINGNICDPKDIDNLMKEFRNYPLSFLRLLELSTVIG